MIPNTCPTYFEQMPFFVIPKSDAAFVGQFGLVILFHLRSQQLRVENKIGR
jgi:hypothetical protein